MNVAAAFLSGLLLGSGLVISGMANPAIVLGFLDIIGDWNPALLFVMAGALAVALPGYRIIKGHKPLFADEQLVPTRRDIDTPLVAGAVIFGIGWGLAGICPGPAVTMLGIDPKSALIFLGAMTAGIVTRLMVARFSRD
ncbi:MAG: YeeE/YedE family protein [Hyphomicrobiales bacterium]|nr:YeeE/YedE family protein [Hyphomicrobiales bacterium]